MSIILSVEIVGDKVGISISNFCVDCALNSCRRSMSSSISSVDDPELESSCLDAISVNRVTVVFFADGTPWSLIEALVTIRPVLSTTRCYRWMPSRATIALVADRSPGH